MLTPRDRRPHSLMYLCTMWCAEFYSSYDNCICYYFHHELWSRAICRICTSFSSFIKRSYKEPATINSHRCDWEWCRNLGFIPWFLIWFQRFPADSGLLNENLHIMWYYTDMKYDLIPDSRITLVILLDSWSHWHDLESWHVPCIDMTSVLVTIKLYTAAQNKISQVVSPFRKFRRICTMRK